MILFFVSFQSAHMAMIEAIMQLFVKEVLGGGRVAAAVSRVHPPSSSVALGVKSSSSQGQEESLLLWVNASCAKLSTEVEARLESRVPGDDDELDALVKILFFFRLWSHLIDTITFDFSCLSL
jgi:hypothetical protein